MDHKRFVALWKRCVGTAADGALRRIADLYGEPHRRYHGADHIAHCLGQLDLAAHVVPNVDAVEMALWFHDAVYAVPCAPAADNEARSAGLFESLAGSASPNFVADVRRLILATAHRRPPTAPDEGFAADIDLSGFGSSWTAFVRDANAIRAEQPLVPGAVFHARQDAFLRGLLARPRFYATTFFRNRYERAARGNVARYLALPKPVSQAAWRPAE